MKTKQIVLATHPKGLPKATDFRMEEVELPGLKKG